MASVTFLTSLMAFNERVLSLGSLKPGQLYSIRELKEKLFFNQIFISNTDELFQKFDCVEIVDRYIDGVNEYIDNIDAITETLEATEPSICLKVDEDFEERLMIERRLTGHIAATLFKDYTNVRYRFIGGVIYYLTLLPNRGLAISFIDPRKEIYDRPLRHDNGDWLLYWKTDASIRRAIDRRYGTTGTLAVRIIGSLNDSSVTKVEFDGDETIMGKLLHLFPGTPLVLKNPYLYTKDLKQIIDQNLQEKPVELQRQNPLVELEDYLLEELLIEYPNESFDGYLEMLEAAIEDKNVYRIRLSLYRIGDNPKIYYLLREAIRNGKEVHVNIELQASGEEINLFWAEEMRRIGVNVTHFMNGVIKVHSKLTLIEFYDRRRVAQIGTGNYHTQTTTQYTDLSFVTSDPEICEGIYNLFELFGGTEPNARGRAQLFKTKKLLVTRFNAVPMLLKLIKGEADKGAKGYIAIKCNALDDPMIIDALDEAAQKGCRIDLIIRGVCTWIPKQLGLNVMIKSIVWDKLEHSRVFCFGSSNPIVYLGSLDLVTNKLTKRIETLVRIDDVKILQQLCDYLNRYIINYKNSWRLMSNGEYEREV